MTWCNLLSLLHGFNSSGGNSDRGNRNHNHTPTWDICSIYHGVTATQAINPGHNSLPPHPFLLVHFVPCIVVLTYIISGPLDLLASHNSHQVGSYACQWSTVDVLIQPIQSMVPIEWSAPKVPNMFVCHTACKVSLQRCAHFCNIKTLETCLMLCTHTVVC